MRYAYADPPYLGCGKLYREHPEWADYDKIETHQILIERLSRDYDAWALSLHSPSLKDILPLCPPDCRVMAWVKPFCSYKPGVNPAYAWEPVIVRGPRKKARTELTVRDWVSCNITLKKGLTGAKPEGFCHWLFDMLGMTPEDEFHDLFPGTGGVTAAWEAWRQNKMTQSTG